MPAKTSLPFPRSRNCLRIRRLRRTDSIGELTRLLHRAYRAKAKAGLRFLASHQDEETTRRRAFRGECHIGLLDGRMVATISLRLGEPGGRASDGGPLPRAYKRRDTAIFSQFAVEPTLQGSGIGSRLLSLAERRAFALGARRLACDTAEGAKDLVRYYRTRGFRPIGKIRWGVINYRSVVLAKPLGRPR